MPLVTLKSVLQDAKRGGYAVGSFNFNGIEDARGIIEAAVEKSAPVILMTSVSALEYIGVDAVAAYIRGLCRHVDIPVVLHLDHATDAEVCMRCIDNGYTSDMIDASAKSFKENIALTQEVVHYASKYGVSVEAELGKLGGREENIVVDEKASMLTNPDDVPVFVKATGVDALAVAIGTAHGFYKEEPKLDFERLAKIASLTDVPLVLHGGTGVPEEDFIRAVKTGIQKINVGTELKYCVSQTVRKNCAEKPDQIDIRKLVGDARKNCHEIVAHKIDLFGSAGKA